MNLASTNLDWDDLKVFLAVARTESLSGAGRALGRDPATIGRRVARLEDVLGAALFLRSQQGYGLTEAGAALLDHAEAAEEAVARGSEALAGRAGRLAGQVRIGAPDGCANFLLPQVLARISAAHPGLELQVVALPRVVNLSKREADLAIAVSPPEGGRVTATKITDYRLHLAAAHVYLARAKPLKTLEDLADHPLIGYVPDMIFDKELDYLSDLGVDRVALASNSVSVQLGFLRQGAGIGVTHDFALPFAPELLPVLTDAVSLTRSFYLVRHASDATSLRLSRVADLLISGMRAEVARLEGAATI